ncbi:MAG: hypothetical protein JW937_09115, partial [Candidatus Omnitrophica bacterium]|nr:hypothetical protein [Candidatus Omnitrophota bacterium]
MPKPQHSPSNRLQAPSWMLTSLSDASDALEEQRETVEVNLGSVAGSHLALDVQAYSFQDVSGAVFAPSVQESGVVRRMREAASERMHESLNPNSTSSLDSSVGLGLKSWGQRWAVSGNFVPTRELFGEHASAYGYAQLVSTDLWASWADTFFKVPFGVEIQKDVYNQFY